MFVVFVVRRGSGFSNLFQALLARVPWSEGCALCGRDDNPNKTLICDRCDREIHMFCLEPKLKKVRQQRHGTRLVSLSTPRGIDEISGIFLSTVRK